LLVRSITFKVRVLLHSAYLSLRLGRRVHVNWGVADLVVRRGGYCPCRFGRVPENRCPCRRHLSEILKHGRCKCGLFFTEGKERSSRNARL